MLRVVNPRRVKTQEDQAQYQVDLRQVTGSPGYPADEAWLRDLGRRSYERGGLDVAAVPRALWPTIADEIAALARRTVPAVS